MRRLAVAIHIASRPLHSRAAVGLFIVQVAVDLVRFTQSHPTPSDLRLARRSSFAREEQAAAVSFAHLLPIVDIAKNLPGSGK